MAGARIGIRRLRENLDQEEEALKKAEKGMKKLLKEKVAA